MATQSITKGKSRATKPAPEADGAAAPEVMTLAEAAAWLRVPEEGLRTDVVAGRVPARLVAGEWRFNKSALVVWFGQPEPESNRPKSGAELVARIQAINRNFPSKETQDEAEAFIAYLYKMRKTGWSEG
jgi:hypothetical protein